MTNLHILVIWGGGDGQSNTFGAELSIQLNPQDKSKIPKYLIDKDILHIKFKKGILVDRSQVTEL